MVPLYQIIELSFPIRGGLMRNCNVKSILVKDFLEISGVKVALLLGELLNL